MPERKTTQNHSTHLCRWNLTSDTILSVLLPFSASSFLSFSFFTRCVCLSDSVFCLTSKERRAFLYVFHTREHKVHQLNKERKIEFQNEWTNQQRKHFKRLFLLAQMFIYSIFGSVRNEKSKTQCGGDVMTVYWILSLTGAFPLAHTQGRGIS